MKIQLNSNLSVSVMACTCFVLQGVQNSVHKQEHAFFARKQLGLFSGYSQITSIFERPVVSSQTSSYQPHSEPILFILKFIDIYILISIAT